MMNVHHGIEYIFVGEESWFDCITLSFLTSFLWRKNVFSLTLTLLSFSSWMFVKDSDADNNNNSHIEREKTFSFLHRMIAGKKEKRTTDFVSPSNTITEASIESLWRPTNMETKVILAGWLIHLFACFYFVRPIRSLLHRALLTLLPCVLLTVISTRDLPYFHMTSIMAISLCWMTMIRLIHLIVLSPSDVQTLRTYAWKFLWLLVPIIPCKSPKPLGYYLALATAKLLLTHWIHRWLLTCEASDSYARVAMFFVSVCAGPFVTDLQIALVQLVTQNRYTVLEFNNYPFLSKSVREFWGRRYNRLISSLLKESIFDPVRRLPFSSSAIAALTSFIISGLLHGHVALGGFGAPSPVPAILFFVLQGFACCVEIMCPFTLPKPIAIILTQGFLLMTAPLYLGLFTRAGPEFYQLNKPPLSDVPWLPKIPVPSYCPKWHAPIVDY